MENTQQEIIEMLEGLAYALNMARVMIEDGQMADAITTLLATARLLDATGPALCVHAMKGHGLTEQQVIDAMTAGHVLTAMDDEVEAFPGLTPEDFA